MTLVSTNTKSYANYQDLLKALAIVAVILDHYALFFMYPEGMWIRAIGRGIMPVFCFFVGYNFSKPKTTLAILGAILTFAIYKCWAAEGHMINMLAMIYLGQWYLYFMNRYNQTSNLAEVLHVVVLILLTPLTWSHIEYGTLGMAFMIVGRRAKEGREFASFLPLLAISTMAIFVNYYDGFWKAWDIIIMMLSVSTVCFAMAKWDFKKKISIDLRILSRHTLLIYFIDYGGHLAYVAYLIYGIA